MPLLKEIGNLNNATGVSLIKSSPIWNQSVDQITSYQFGAFIFRMKEQGLADEAETAVEIVMRETMKAVGANEISPPKYLEYQRASHIRLTAGELRRGLIHAQQPYAAAILFALELGLTEKGVASMTWRHLTALTETRSISKLAKECLLACPRNLSAPYVFWINNGKKVVGLFNLSEVVFDAFGLTWGELEVGYKNLIMIDGEADLKSLDCFFSR